jgi:hypothetical protein
MDEGAGRDDAGRSAEGCASTHAYDLCLALLRIVRSALLPKCRETGIADTVVFPRKCFDCVTQGPRISSSGQLPRVQDTSRAGCGAAPAAPKFNIVSKPNQWPHSVATAARVIDEGELSETRRLQQRYWTAFNARLETVGGPVSGRRKAQPRAWMSYSISRSSMSLNGVVLIARKQIRAELYLRGPDCEALCCWSAASRNRTRTRV